MTRKPRAAHQQSARKGIGARRSSLPTASLTGLSDKFDFELFSPHIEDMDCSNNCSIVLKLTGLGARGFSYLITGDTENPRWETINKLFGNALKSHVLAAPHHGSKNATHPASLLNIAPAHGADQRRRGQPIRPSASAGSAGL